MPDFSRMAKWQGSFEYRRSDAVTVAASFATIEVRDPGGLGLKTLWADEAGTIPQANPFVIDANGWAEFFVRPPDGEFDIHVSAPAGEFASFTKRNIRAFLTGRKVFAVRDYSDLYNALADLVAIGVGGKILFERDVTLAAGLPINLNGMTGVVLEGINPDVTISAPANHNVSLVENTNTTRCTIRNLRFDGNKANQTAQTIGAIGISNFNSTEALLENVQIVNCESDGTEIAGSTDLRAKNVLVEGCHGHGFVHGGAGSRAFRPYLFQCRAITNGNNSYGPDPWPRNNGFDFEPMPAFAILRDCYASDNEGSGYLWGSENAAATYRGNRMEDCTSWSNNRQGAATGIPGCVIFVQNGHTSARCEDFQIIGGTFYDENEAGILVQGGITGSPTQADIRGLRIVGVSCYTNARYGLRIESNVFDATIDSCQAWNNANDGLGVGIGISVQGVNSPPLAECRRVSIVNCQAWDDRGGVARQQTGFVLATFTYDCILANTIAYGNVVQNYSYGNSTNPIVHDIHDL